MSGGTLASLVGAMRRPLRVPRRPRPDRARREGVRSFQRRREGAPGDLGRRSEHFALPRLAPRLREVNAYLGWFGPVARRCRLFAGTSTGRGAGGVERLWRRSGERFVKGSTGGPDAAARARTGSHIVAIAYDSAGAGSRGPPEGSTATRSPGRMLAWGAQRAADGRAEGTGALGPVDGFGLDGSWRGPRRRGSRRRARGAQAAWPEGSARQHTAAGRGRAQQGGRLAALALAAGALAGPRAATRRRAARERTPSSARLAAARAVVDRLTLRQQVGQVTISSFPGAARPTTSGGGSGPQRDGRRDPVRRHERRRRRPTGGGLTRFAPAQAAMAAR